ncbi:MAG TPA: universal stress protein [Phycisphaerae bacterium]|nr:universal stress protein [Phycisphaerae bacterium]
MKEIKRILYATDFSDLSAYALDYAASLAQRCAAELTCLHVIDDSYQYWLSMEVTTIPAGPPVDELLAAGRKQLDEFIADKIPDEVRVKTKVLSGRPFVEIIRFARQQGMDMIVLGTHGRTGLKHVLMGSVAEKVSRKSPCPVLTVRHPGHPFEMP